MNYLIALYLLIGVSIYVVNPFDFRASGFHSLKNDLYKYNIHIADWLVKLFVAFIIITGYPFCIKIDAK